MLAVSNSERKRALQSLTFAESTTLTRDLPLDAVLKGLQIRLSGSVVTTFASGTPVADAFSTFDNLVQRIEVIVDGRRTVKSMRPYFLQQQQLLFTKILGERKSSAGAAAATGNNPTVDAGFTYGTTTQITTAAETLWIPFEMIWCDLGKGRESTYLNLRGRSSAVLKLVCNPFSSLLGFGNTAPVVFSSSTFQFDITTIEAPDAPDADKFEYFDWRQLHSDYPFSGQVNASPIPLPSGNILTGIAMLTRDGAAGSATTATGKLRTDLLVNKYSVKLAGQQEIHATTWLEQRAENLARYGVSAPYASNVSRMTGFAYVNFLQYGDIRTGLNVIDRASNPMLFVDTRSGSDVSYTNPAVLTVQTEEIAPAR